MYKNNKELFDKINSDGYKSRDAALLCKEFKVGNDYQKFNRTAADPNWQSATSKLNLMDDSWFVNKRVLDIGCHDGSMDLILAARYSPSLLIGTDIDHKLTSKAMKNMHGAINNQEQMALIT